MKPKLYQPKQIHNLKLYSMPQNISKILQKIALLNYLVAYFRQCMQKIGFCNGTEFDIFKHGGEGHSYICLRSQRTTIYDLLKQDHSPTPQSPIGWSCFKRRQYPELVVRRTKPTELLYVCKVSPILYQLTAFLALSSVRCLLVS